MKTPREVLLERHRAAVPKLDDIRQRVLAEKLRQPGSAGIPAGVFARPTIPGWFSLAWRELIWPCRRMWAGLALLWVILIGVNLSLAGRAETVAIRIAPPTPEAMLAFWRQEQILAKLIESSPPRVASPPRPAASQPRSEARPEFFWSPMRFPITG